MGNFSRTIGCLFAVLVAGASALLTTDYMADECGKIMDIGTGGGEIYSQIGISYSPNLDCNLTIRAEVGRKLLIHFMRLDVEGNEGNCQSDFLEVFGGLGRSPLFPELGVFCGYMTPEDVVSETGTVFLRFKTDGSVQEMGFKFKYGAYRSSALIPCSDTEFECKERCFDKSLENEVGFCGADILSNLDDEIENYVNKAFSLGIGILVAIIVGCIVGVVLCCVCVGCICYHCCCKKSQPQQQTTYQVVSQNPQQQPPMAMQPTGEVKA